MSTYVPSDCAQLVVTMALPADPKNLAAFKWDKPELQSVDISIEEKKRMQEQTLLDHLLMNVDRETAGVEVVQAMYQKADALNAISDDALTSKVKEYFEMSKVAIERLDHEFAQLQTFTGKRHTGDALADALLEREPYKSNYYNMAANVQNQTTVNPLIRKMESISQSENLGHSDIAYLIAEIPTMRRLCLSTATQATEALVRQVSYKSKLIQNAATTLDVAKRELDQLTLIFHGVKDVVNSDDKITMGLARKDATAARDKKIENKAKDDFMIYLKACAHTNAGFDQIAEKASSLRNFKFVNEAEITEVVEFLDTGVNDHINDLLEEEMPWSLQSAHKTLNGLKIIIDMLPENQRDELMKDKFPSKLQMISWEMLTKLLKYVLDFRNWSKAMAGASGQRSQSAIAKAVKSCLIQLDAVPQGFDKEKWDEAKQKNEKLLKNSAALHTQFADELVESTETALKKIIGDLTEQNVKMNFGDDLQPDCDEADLKQAMLKSGILSSENKDRLFKMFTELVKSEKLYKTAVQDWSYVPCNELLDKAKEVKNTTCVRLWEHNIGNCVFGKGRAATTAKAQEVYNSGKGLDPDEVEPKLFDLLVEKGQLPVALRRANSRANRLPGGAAAARGSGAGGANAGGLEMDIEDQEEEEAAEEEEDNKDGL